MTSQTAQECEQLTDTVCEGSPARGLVGVGFYPPAHLGFSFLLRGLPHLPPSRLAPALRSWALFAFQVLLGLRLRCCAPTASLPVQPRGRWAVLPAVSSTYTAPSGLRS